jgi:predicted nucleic acid-binding protein
MTPRYGIDTSILVRLLTGDPPEGFDLCCRRLEALAKETDILASNQVIGEAYVAVQHHYGVTKKEAKEGLLDVLRSGLVGPLMGEPVLEVLREEGGCGLLDRLIALDYAVAELETLTLDARMARLPKVSLLA